MAIDRSKFKSTSVASMVEADKEVEKAIGKAFKERADQLSIEEGKNKFRLYPAHAIEDGGGDKFAEPVVRVFLPMMVDEMKDGKPVMEGGKPKQKESARPVFNSRIHGNTEKDLVEEYRKLATKVAEERFGDDEDKKGEFLLPILGKFSKVASERMAGIQDRQTWVAYADRITEKDGNESFKFGRLEFGKAVKDRLNKLSAMESGDEPLGTDPFTPVEGGRAIIVIYNKQATKPADYYITEMDTSTTRQKIGNKEYPIAKEYPLTDEQLEKFMAYPTLKSLFVGAFKRSDFALQLKGLEYFDGKYKMGLWEMPEWEEIVEEISAYYPEGDSSDDADDEEEGPMTAKKKTTVEEDDEEEEDIFDDMDREELKKYNKDHDFGIVVKKSVTDEDLRNQVRAAAKAAELATEDEEEDEEDDEEEDSSEDQQPEEKKEEKKTEKKSEGGSKGSLAEKLNKIKNKKGDDLPF